MNKNYNFMEIVIDINKTGERFQNFTAFWLYIFLFLF